MPGTERVFRVFISSTFGDMVAERTVLQEEVFPRLQSFCRERGGRFQAIDLRWGVSDQAARDRRTMGICIEEIQRCRQVSPALNFLVLLGNRYGWRPIPAEIDAGDFDRLREAATRGGRKILERAYRRDDNARPARYVLLAQQDEAESVENALRAAFVQALAAAFPEEDPRRIAYGASATHLEIAERLSHDPADARNVFCYMREAASRASLEHQSPVDREDLARLKVELESRLGSRQVRRYRLRTSRRRSDADAFAARIESDLRKVIEKELREHRRRPALDREIDEQRRFAVERARHVIGREDILARLRAYLSGNETHPLAIVGRSGSGKTSVMARAFLDLTSAEQHSGAVVISRFVGATPDTADIELLLRSIGAELGRAYGDAQPPPMRYRELEKDFQRRLAAATPERPLHLFLDALDQNRRARLRAAAALAPSRAPHRGPPDPQRPRGRRRRRRSLEDDEGSAAGGGVRAARAYRSDRRSAHPRRVARGSETHAPAGAARRSARRVPARSAAAAAARRVRTGAAVAVVRIRRPRSPATSRSWPGSSTAGSKRPGSMDRSSFAAASSTCARRASA